MSEMKRVVRKDGKIIGVEPGDPHAPDAQAWRSATKALADAQGALQQAIAATGVPLPQDGAPTGLSDAVETLAESWHTVPDDARYQLVGHVRAAAKGTARSARDLATALLKAEEEANNPQSDLRWAPLVSAAPQLALRSLLRGAFYSKGAAETPAQSAA